MVRAVLFDLDRTLLDRDTSFEIFAAAQYDRFRTALHGVDKTAYVSRLIELDARGAVWKDSVYQRLVCDLSLNSVSWEELFADFDANIAGSYRPFPKLHETLFDLSRDCLLGVITNGRADFQKRTLAALGIAHHFQVVLISESEGVRKPDREIFHRALRRLACDAAQAVYVGDHPVSDIEGARRAGLSAIWKRNPDFPEPFADGAIDCLGELPEILKELNQRGRLPKEPASA